MVCPDVAFAAAYGEVEAYLRRHGTPIPTIDLLIGVTARMNGLALLTRDVQHFRLIPDLVVETH